VKKIYRNSLPAAGINRTSDPEKAAQIKKGWHCHPF